MLRSLSLRIAQRLCKHEREEDWGILDYGREQAWRCTRCARTRIERRA